MCLYAKKISTTLYYLERKIAPKAELTEPDWVHRQLFSVMRAREIQQEHKQCSAWQNKIQTQMLPSILFVVLLRTV